MGEPLFKDYIVIIISYINNDRVLMSVQSNSLCAMMIKLRRSVSREHHLVELIALNLNFVLGLVV